MKTVYRQASQVLVLDLALAEHPAEGAHPASLLLRIMASSLWMRRLWTLQGMVLFGCVQPIADSIKRACWLNLSTSSSAIGQFMPNH